MFVLYFVLETGRESCARGLPECCWSVGVVYAGVSFAEGARWSEGADLIILTERPPGH